MIKSNINKNHSNNRMDVTNVYYFEGLNSYPDTAVLSLLGDIRGQGCQPIELYKDAHKNDQLSVTVKHVDGTLHTYEIGIDGHGDDDFYAYTISDDSNFLDLVPTKY